MIALTSRTGTLSTIAALQAAGWGWMVGPLDHGTSDMFGMPHALDNGAWPAFQTGQPWDEAAFRKALARYGPGALFVVAPDVVGQREASMALTLRWLPELLARPDLAGVPILFAVQDGMTFADVEPHVGGRVGLFIGGSTEWKLQAIIPWGRWGRERGLYVHVGRVNTARRMALCAAAGATSVDGNSAIMFPKTLPMLDGARRQPDLFHRP